MLDLMTQPSVTPAKLLFQQCVAESSTEGNTFNFIRNEISGYLLNAIEPRALRKNVGKKLLLPSNLLTSKRSP